MTEVIFKVLKITVIVAICAVFMAAISSLITMLTTIVFHTVIGEVFAILSCCLPFNALAVFGAIGNACIAILSFLIAKKIFDLTSWSISAI